MTAAGFALLTMAMATAAEALPRARHAFRAYGAEQGLLNLAIQCMAQDTTGFLWVGTEEGLFRYDGQKFHRYGLEEGLPSTYIEQVVAGADGSVWVGTQGGLACLRGNRFEPILPVHGLPSGWIWDLAVAPGGHVWVASEYGLFHAPGGRAFSPVAGWPGGACTALALGNKADLYVAGKSGLGHRFPDGTWRFTGPGSGLGPDRIEALMVDARNRLWVRSNLHLWVREPGSAGFEPRDRGLSRGVTRGRLMLGSQGTVWVPTNLGLAQWDESGKRWTVLNVAQGLPSNLVSAAFQDREGSLWVGAAGLHRWLGRGEWSAYGQQEGLPSDVIWCIFRDHAGQLWVGTDQGLSRATPTGWVTLPESRGHAVRDITETSDGKLWLGGSPLELLRYDPRSGRVDRFGVSAGLRGKRLMSLQVDLAGRLWVAMDGGGLLVSVTDGKAPGGLRFEPVSLPQGTPTEYIRALALDPQGRLWVAGMQGLACLDEGIWRRFTTQDGLQRNYVSYLDIPASGGIRFAYFEPLGVSQARYEKGRLLDIEHLASRKGLTSEKIYFMGEDTRGRLWLGSGHGVDLVVPEGVQHLGRAEGLPGEDCDANAFLADRNGDVWIGTSSGLAHFDGSAPVQTIEPPRLTLLSMEMGGQVVAQPQATSLEFPHRDSTLEVRFAGLSFLNEAQVHYQVRLLPLEPEWRQTDLREARYPVLPHGRYTFEVRTRQSLGPWSEVTRVTFRIRPAWWQTWWCRGLAILALAVLVTAYIRWRITSLRRHNLQLERLVGERTEQLSRTNHALGEANKALEERSITDPLTGLKNRRFLMDHLGEDIAMVHRHYQTLQRGQIERLPKNIDLLFLMVDIDHFKEVNDHYGHAAGDLVLQQIRDLLLEASRDSDTPVRWGGEEFLVIGRYTDREYAAVFAERIRSKVAAFEFNLGDGRTLHRTCSIGFASYPFMPSEPDRFNWEAVVGLADQCLYAAKASGRNTWVGVQLGETAPPPDLGERLHLGLEPLVAAGYLSIVSSLPSDTPLQWGG